VALNLVSRSPDWLTAIGAKPMYLGLDLRGGVHFMLQVDMAGGPDQEGRELCGRSALFDARQEHPPRRCQPRRQQRHHPRARRSHADGGAQPDRGPVPRSGGHFLARWHGFKLVASIKPEALRKVQEQALKQNIVTLHNRINELGVAEPVIQQQGLDRIVVQLPGVQDTAKAKDILGRTATLEVRMVDESAEARAAEMGSGPVPFGSEKYLDRNGQA
jgi:preprotein translocase subunit SecD